MGIFTRHSVSVDEAARRTQAGAVLLDVRTKAELRDGVARGSRHVSLDNLSKRISALAGQEVYVICRSGSRSRRAAAALRRQGIDASNVRGGIIAWRRSNLPISKGRKEAQR